MDKIPIDIINKILIMREPTPTAKLIKDLWNNHKSLRINILSLNTVKTFGNKGYDHYLERMIDIYWIPSVTKLVSIPLNKLYKRKDVFFS